MVVAAKKILYYKNFIIGIVIIAMAIFIAKDMLQKYKLMMKKIEAQREQLEKGKEAIAKWQTITSEIDKLTKSFFSKDTTLFKTFVEQQAQISGISINSLSPSNKEKDFYWESIITIKGNSRSYANITKFISALESENIGTESLHIKSDAKKRVIDIVLKAFVMNE